MYIEKQIKKSGSSYVVYLSKAMLKEIGLTAGDNVKVYTENNSLIIKKTKETEDKWITALKR